MATIFVDDTVPIQPIDENIKVKLKGFKEAYELENTPDNNNHVTIEHYYDVAKREVVQKEVVRGE